MREITGRKVLIGFVSAFGVILTANLTLAFNAISTFPGVETRNSYTASQNFDRKRSAQLALGWDVSAEIAGGELRLSITDPQGRPVNPAAINATLGKATHVKADMTPDFAFVNGVHVAPVTAEPGNWNLRMKAVAEDGTPFEQRIVIYVRS
jgi:nitrogen fixation protein FixH